MKYLLITFFSCFSIVANAKLGLFFGVNNISNLRYSPTIGLGLSVGISCQKHIIYGKVVSSTNQVFKTENEKNNYQTYLTTRLYALGYQIYKHKQKR